MNPKNAYFQTWKPLIEPIKNFKFTNIFVYQQTLLTYTPVSHACTGLTLKAVGRSYLSAPEYHAAKKYNAWNDLVTQVVNTVILAGVIKPFSLDAIFYFSSH